MTIWKTPDGLFLVRGEARPIPMGVSVGLPGGGTLTAAAKYFLVGADGAVARVYGAPAGYSLDETLGICDIHAVVGTYLWSLHWVDHAMDEPVVRSTVALSGLVALEGEQPPFDAREIVAEYERRFG